MYALKQDNFMYGARAPQFGNQQSFGGDRISFPSPSPFPVGGYGNYVPPQNNFQYPDFGRQGNEQNYKMPIQQNKSFIDGFGNNSSLLNQQKSHARNIKGRLFNNNDPMVEQAKQDKMKAYRNELQRQMEQDKERKRIEKEKIQKEELERERKFYEEFKIKAQDVNKEVKGDGDPSIVMRTAQNRRKKGKTDPNQSYNKQLINPEESPKPPKNFHHRDANEEDLKNYPRESSRNQQRQKMNESFQRQRNFEQERLAKLLLFQQRVLQKISDIKQQIRKTSSHLQTDKEIQRIRRNLRARPLIIDNIESQKSNKGNMDTSPFYLLPKRVSTRVKSRQDVRLRDLSSQKSHVKQNTEELRQKNDKNLDVYNLEDPALDQ